MPIRYGKKSPRFPLARYGVRTTGIIKQK